MIIYGYYAHKLLEQGEKVLKRDYERHREHFLATAKKNQLITEDILKEWKIFASQLLIEIPNPEVLPNS